ncbi:MAG: DUF2987 domain-containing protein [Psychromonas sp.]
MRFTFLLLSLLISQNTFASTLKLDYSLFFGYMKTMYKLDYPDVTTAFYLVDPTTGNNCTIESAEIVVDNVREKIDFQAQGRLLPFYSNDHRKDGATLQVKTSTVQSCALQVTIMVKESHLTSLNVEKLTTISAQLEGLLRKNAGMIGKYFLPTFQGLRFKLASPMAPTEQLDPNYQLANNGDLLITNEVLQGTKPSTLLPYKVLRITPWIVK